jgi:nucleoside-diphosphate-sugar epimerase
MKIVVIGGSGLIGSKLVKKLREDGHDPLAASPDSGVDTLTGEGLAEALECTDWLSDPRPRPGTRTSTCPNRKEALLTRR